MIGKRDVWRYRWRSRWEIDRGVDRRIEKGTVLTEERNLKILANFHDTVMVHVVVELLSQNSAKSSTPLR
jgi:hypothetical protein